MGKQLNQKHLDFPRQIANNQGQSQNINSDFRIILKFREVSMADKEEYKFYRYKIDYMCKYNKI